MRTVLCVLLLVLAAAAPTTQPTPPLLVAARNVLETMKESHYSHKTTVDEANGVYDVDCSGLVCYLLGKTSPTHLQAIPHRGHTRPLALQFYDAFSMTAPPQGWTAVDPAKAQPGDVIAWRKVEQIKGQNTGHVMIINATPVLEDGGLLRVEIIDSSGSHHFEDTRPKDVDGIGKGTIWLVLDEKGKAIGFKWSSRKGRTISLPIAIGRPI